MRIARVAIFPAALIACSNGENIVSPSPSPTREPTHVLGDANVADTNVLGLAPEREEFWAKYIGASPGAPGPTMLTWCRNTVDEDRDITPGLWIAIQDHGAYCAFVARGRTNTSLELVGELDRALSRWGEPVQTLVGRDRSSIWIDADNKLNANVDWIFMDDGSTPFQINVHWDRYVPLESVIGASGTLLTGIDVEHLVGKAPKALGNAVRAPFQIDHCDADVCVANGPSLAGGSRTRILTGTLYNGGLDVELFPASHDMSRVLATLDASLGPRQEQDSSGWSYLRGDVRYRVSVWDWNRGVSVRLSRRST